MPFSFVVKRRPPPPLSFSPIGRIIPLILTLPILPHPRHKPSNRTTKPRHIPHRLLRAALHRKRHAGHHGRPKHEPEQQARDPQHHAPDPREHLEGDKQHQDEEKKDDNVGRVGEEGVEAREERVHDGREEGEGLALEEVEGRGG